MVISASNPAGARRVGVLGGTFDPVHHGHLRLAVGMRELISLDEVLLVPNSAPPHRPQPLASVAQRCRMLELALDGQPGLRLDRREVERAGASYAVDTMAELRAQLGPEAALFFLIGSDAFAGLAGWHEWQRLPGLCNFAVALRPGCDREQLFRRCPATLDDLLGSALDTVPPQVPPAGLVLLLGGDWPDISATSIRAGCTEAADPGLPGVAEYIRQQGLYQAVDKR